MDKRRGSAFYGDSGTVFNGAAREQIEKDSAGRGHRGNDVDFSQRYAQSEDDEHTAWAERVIRDLGKDWQFGIPKDPEERRRRIESMAEQSRGKPAVPVKRQEPKDEEVLSRAADDKFWSDPEEMKKAGKMVRPAKL